MSKALQVERLPYLKPAIAYHEFLDVFGFRLPILQL